MTVLRRSSHKNWGGGRIYLQSEERIEPVTAGREVQTLLQCYAVPPPVMPDSASLSTLLISEALHSRMAALLGLTESAAEESLNSMVVAKSVQAKIDRLDGIVDFTKSMDPNEVTKLEYLYEP